MHKVIDCQGLGGGFTLGAVQAGFELVHRASLQGGFGDQTINANRHLVGSGWEQDPGLSWDQWEPQEGGFLCGTPPCFAAGTIILTKRGTIAIEDVRVGDEVLTHRLRWRRVRSTGSKVAETIRVGPTTECTPGHQWYSAPWQREIDGDFIGWIDADKLHGKGIATPLDIDFVEPPALPSQMTWWSVGRWLGDGWTTENHGDLNTTVICCGHHETDALAFALGPEWRLAPHETADKFWISDRNLASWLREHFGKGAHGKRLPAWVFSLSYEHKTELLSGYASSDGHKTISSTRIGTVSRALAVGTRLLAINLGYTASIGVRAPIENCVIDGREVSSSTSYEISYFENDNRYTRDLDGIRWTKVRRAPVTAPTQRVWDLEVEEDHSFTADGYIVHNCSGFSSLNTRDARGPGADVNKCMVQLVDYAGRCVGQDGRPGPEIVCLESVQAAFTKGRNLMQHLWSRIEDETDQTYELHHVLMSGASVGAAQRRHRYFMVLSRVPFGIDPPRREDLPDERPATYSDAIGDLEEGKIQWEYQPYPHVKWTTRYQDALRSQTGQFDGHFTAGGLVGAAAAEAACLGWEPGTFLSEAFDSLDFHPERFQKSRDFQENTMRRGKSSYRGLNWPYRVKPDEIGYVLAGSCARDYAHYEEPRLLTIRELSRLMGYPDDWRWPHKVTTSSLQIGKCAPVPSTRWLSTWARRALDGEPGAPGRVIGEDEYLHQSTNAYKEWLDVPGQ